MNSNELIENYYAEMNRRERYDLLVQQLKDNGAKIVHYPQDVLGQEQYLIYIYDDNNNTYSLLSMTFDDTIEDSFSYMIINSQFGLGQQTFLSFQSFFENITEDYKSIFVFYLDIFDEKSRFLNGK